MCSDKEFTVTQTSCIAYFNNPKKEYVRLVWQFIKQLCWGTENVFIPTWKLVALLQPVLFRNQMFGRVKIVSSL